MAGWHALTIGKGVAFDAMPCRRSEVAGPMPTRFALLLGVVPLGLPDFADRQSDSN
jgi:hypothetical protein